MSDQQPTQPSPSLDPITLLMRVTHVESALTTNTAAVERMTKEVHEMTRHFQSLQSTGSGLERAFGAIKDTNARIDRMLDELTRSNQLRADEHTKWRTDHVADNVKAEKQMSRWSGFASAGVFFIGTIVTLIAMNYTGDKANMLRDMDVARAERKALAERQAHSEQVMLIMCQKLGQTDCKPFR
jgi:hypothetical protein